MHVNCRLGVQALALCALAALNRGGTYLDETSTKDEHRVALERLVSACGALGQGRALADAGGVKVSLVNVLTQIDVMPTPLAHSPDRHCLHPHLHLQYAPVTAPAHPAAASICRTCTHALTTRIMQHRPATCTADLHLPLLYMGSAVVLCRTAPSSLLHARRRRRW